MTTTLNITDITSDLQTPFNALMRKMFSTEQVQQIVHDKLADKMKTFFAKVCEKYEDVEMDVLVEMFDACSVIAPLAKSKKTKKTKKSKAKNSPAENKVIDKSESESDNEEIRCQAILGPRSARQGQTCGAKCKTGLQFCGTHSKTQIEKKEKPKPHQKTKEFIQPNRSKNKKKSPVKDKSPSPALSDAASNESMVDIAITKNKFGNLQDPDTLFVFNPDQTIFGKQDPETGEMIPLNEEDHMFIEHQGWELADEHDDNNLDTDVDE